MRDLIPDVVERNYGKVPFSSAELQHLVRGCGGVATLMNLRHAHAKAEGWATKPPSSAAFVAAVLAEPNLIRRPVILRGKRALMSRDEAEIRAFLR